MQAKISLPGRNAPEDCGARGGGAWCGEPGKRRRRRGLRLGPQALPQCTVHWAVALWDLSGPSGPPPGLLLIDAAGTPGVGAAAAAIPEEVSCARCAPARPRPNWTARGRT
ncbi:hypothetical protein NDU88_004727 [Pleurodeles waltl]|uniref:Uncharacterized protein n=1 Tax=Pleurodeles waltl TaxID=8319 RepID=A0AAV7TSB4_PLEWA|nr:hypothetical protein NDU88_004727 [Pleurodeles waltl]